MSIPDLPWWGFTALGAAAALLVWLTVALIGGIRRRSKSRPALVLSPNLADMRTPDAAATRILEQVAPWVKGKAFHAYWLNNDRSLLQLRSSLTQPGQPHVAPDYSGLVIENVAAVPLARTPDPSLTAPRLRGTRDERWLDLPFGSELVVTILLGSLGDLPPAEMERIATACQTFKPLVQAIHQGITAQEDAARNRSLIDSTRIALEVTLNTDRAIELLLNVGSQAVAAQASLAIIEGADDAVTIAATPEGRAAGATILQGGEQTLTILPSQPDVVPGSRMGKLGLSHNACVRVPVLLMDGDAVGCFFFFTEQAPALDDYQMAVLRTLGERAAQLLASQRQMQSAAAGYRETLRVLVNAMDGLSPNSQGHSDRLARLARLTAQELGLTNRETEAIALAAYFHDVGMVAVDPRIVLKPNQLTPDEYAYVKRHAELGGQLVASIPAALPLAPIVAGHHERWDGFGYPRGLKGEEIPLGARILAAADLYEAKTSGRPYRAATSFSRTMEELRASAGSLLDPRVADALARGFERLQAGASPRLPLAPCWELKQLPAHVCGNCPNRKPKTVACWESPSNLCTHHGDNCQDCIVYTEAMSRSVAVVR